jgi:hypothetical protein
MKGRDLSMIVVDKSLLCENIIIWYRLPLHQLPKNRLKLWRGKVLRIGLTIVFVESLQEGYEGQTEYVAFADIVFIESDTKTEVRYEQFLRVCL